jgi:hypothetical protein
MEPARFDRAGSWRILLPMTRHKHTHTGLVTPSLPQLLLTAMLRLFAMLASNVASTLQMIARRCLVIGTRAMPAGLPGETSDTQQQETQPAAPDSRRPIALMVSSTQSVRPSNREPAVREADELVPALATLGQDDNRIGGWSHPESVGWPRNIPPDFNHLVPEHGG